MNNFCYISPRKYWELIKDEKKNRSFKSLEQLEKLAKQPERICDVCSQNPVWKLGGCDMCFTCVTGETDASEDYELI